ncbi:MAG: SDR family oxidoreductase [Candidatus Korobacteraceae bacterium]|jgi:NAD(P)-dependent dehydrogenase (short-subunit alcohol dehydrogenase family)
MPRGKAASSVHPSKRKDGAHREPGPLRGKIALVTGGNRGIGLAIARALARLGASVVITGRDEPALAAAVKLIRKASGKVRAVHCNARDPHSVERLFKVIGEEFGRLDILVNNAGLAHPTREIAALPLAEWQEVVETNLTGMFLVTRAALPLMGAGGVIINNLSVAASQVFPGMAAYTASKHGALGLSKTLREELRPRQIRVIALQAGATDTAIWQQFWPEAPRHKMISPETIAEAVVSAILLPENATLSDLFITPSGGPL